MMWTDEEVDKEVKESFQDGRFLGFWIGGAIFGIIGAMAMFLTIWFVTV
jgi:hypothetical protein